VDERRARLVRRHLLAPGTWKSSVAEVARALVAVHATDPATVYLSVRARTRDLDPDAITRELYEERTVVRILGMRRTLFVITREARPLVQTACTDLVAARERARIESWLSALPDLEDVPAAFLADAGRSRTTRSRPPARRRRPSSSAACLSSGSGSRSEAVGGPRPRASDPASSLISPLRGGWYAVDLGERGSPASTAG
jgi:hypothetical protein